MASPYRMKWFPESNVPRDTRISGKFTLTTGGAVGSVTRPSAGSAATAGQGNLFTVAQLSTNNAYQITFTETYLKSVWTDAAYVVPFTTSPGSTTVSAVATAYDATSNSFVVYLINPTTGALLAGSVTTGEIDFEACFINTTSPNSL